MIFRFIR